MSFPSNGFLNRFYSNTFQMYVDNYLGLFTTLIFITSIVSMSFFNFWIPINSQLPRNDAGLVSIKLLIETNYDWWPEMMTCDGESHCIFKTAKENGDSKDKVDWTTVELKL